MEELASNGSTKTNKRLSDRRYYEFIKTDPVKYRALLDKNNERHRRYRLNEEFRDRVNSRKRMNRLIKKERPLSHNLTQLQWAYLAGLIDGEGTIGITKINDKYHPYPTFRGYILISNTYEDVINTIYNWLGVGYIRSSDNNNAKAKDGIIRKTLFTYSVEQLVFIEEILLNIIGYLHIKKKQALNLLMWLMNRKKGDLETNDKYHRQSKELNGYGTDIHS